MNNDGAWLMMMFTLWLSLAKLTIVNDVELNYNENDDEKRDGDANQK